MSNAPQTVHLITSDEALIATVRAAVTGLEGWVLADPQTVEDILGNQPERGDVILLDAWLRTENVYESCRRLTGKTRCRSYIVTDDRNAHASGIAAFCGATGVIERPLSGESLRELLTMPESVLPLAEEQRSTGSQDKSLPESLLRDLSSGSGGRLIDAITDPETGLFSYEYLTFKLDEEYKRAQRFKQPLCCVMLGFDGQANEEVLGQLASIFLNASRDTDVLGRFDQSSFLFFLPNTGPDGARIMAQRIQEGAQSQGLRDLVGDLLEIAVGISSCPHPEVQRREDLFSRSRDAFFRASQQGGVVVSS